MAEYEPKEVDISFSLLLELMDALKRYGSDVVVIGGWAPYFLLKSFSHATEEHVGSLGCRPRAEFPRDTRGSVRNAPPCAGAPAKFPPMRSPRRKYFCQNATPVAWCFAN
jgi:hypothetical protein